MSIDFNVIPVRPGTLLSDEDFERIVGPYAEALEALGGAIGSTTDLDRPEPIFYLVATGGTEGEVMALDGRRFAVDPDGPVHLIAHPDANSLPAALEVLARLRQDGRHGRIFYVAGPDDGDGFDAIATAASDLATHRRLADVRIGLVGEPSDWLVASSPEPQVVADTWGPTVVPISMEEVEAEMSGDLPGESLPVLTSLTDGATAIQEPSPADSEMVVKVSEVLEALVNRHQLDALTVRCFDLVLNQQTTGCFALARLNDNGVIAGCEGDLVSTMAMLWAHELLGETPWMANPAQLDEAENTVWLAHCTVPMSMVDDYRLRSHFESGLGVAIQGTIPNGPVTLIRLGGPEMTEVWLADGDVVAHGDSESLCRTQAKVRLATGNVTDLLTAPLGNHLVMVRGHHAEHLRSWHDTFIAARSEL
jgi:L-fucose isomerase-like protein